MHVLFAHQNFPAQFGHIAAHLIKNEGFRCTFLSELPDAKVGGIERIQYRPTGGSTDRTHYFSRTFENQMWRSHALFEALRQHPEVEPDLIVGHTGFVSTLFLRELYDCPIINYFEYFYRTEGADIDFRRDLGSVPKADFLRARARNALPLLDLESCDAGYAPTEWQRGRLPAEFHSKVRVIFDGIDTQFWQPRPVPNRNFAGWQVPNGMRVVTYVSRGMESLRGFDVFMRIAKRLCQLRKDVLFLVVGEDRIAYGGDARFTEGKTFKQWVLARDDYDLSRILFLSRLPASDLARLLCLTDLHIYLTAPFVLSWSLMDALACEATVLASSTAPVCEMIRHEENGLLADFFDIDQFVAEALRVLDDPEQFAHLGQAGRKMIEERYSLKVCLPQLLNLYETVLNRRPSVSQ